MRQVPRDSLTSLQFASFLLFGYDQGLMSGILTDRQFLITFPQTDTSTGNYHNSLIQALTTAIYEVGALLGSICILIWGDKLGRRKGIFIGAAIMVIGAIIMTSSYSLGQFIVGRIVTGESFAAGLAAGIVQSSNPCNCIGPLAIQVSATV